MSLTLLCVAPSVRRAPGWAVEATSWSAVLVFVAAITILISGVADPTARIVKRVAVAPVVAPAPTPVVEEATSPPVTPAPKPVTKQAPASKTYAIPHAQTAANPLAELGPPPGPQNDARPAATAPPEKRFAFLAGVTDYPAPTHHTIAGAQDVLFIRAMLLRNGWLPQNIRILTDRQVSGDAVREGMQWLANRSQPGTFTLFHWSGHVKQEGGHEKLWPADRDFVVDSEVANTLSKGRGMMWVDIAGCESGGFAAGLPNARTLFTSSSEQSQKSYEFPKWGESVWAGLVWDLSLTQGKADVNHDGVTTVGEALRYSVYYAQAITFNQRPHGRQTPQVLGDSVLGWTLADPPAA